jgi:excinuclease UvrABC nuclease subunit
MTDISQALAERVFALREAARALVPRELPGVPIDGPRFGDMLPAVPAVYFLWSGAAGLLYIGKAGSLRGRWRVTSQLTDNAAVDWELSHSRLRPAIEHGDVSLHWLELPRETIAAVEGVLIQLHTPPWNASRG